MLQYKSIYSQNSGDSPTRQMMDSEFPATRKSDGRHFWVRMFTKSNLDSQSLISIASEISICRKHLAPITSLCLRGIDQVFESSHSIFFVSRNLVDSQGILSLKDKLREKTDTPHKEQARKVEVICLLGQALEVELYLKRKGLGHMEFDPSNYLLENMEESSTTSKSSDS